MLLREGSSRFVGPDTGVGDGDEDDADGCAEHPSR